MLIPLKLVRDQPLQQQIFDQLRGLIQSGRLAPEMRMPSTRMVADQFAVSRITVLLVYERLIAEGYLETIPAKGTFVSHPPAELSGRTSGCPMHEDREASPLPCCGGIGLTQVGRPDPGLFPLARWRALLRGAVDRLGNASPAEHAAGAVRLRQAIAGWLSTSRGLAVAPDQIVLVSGRQQALHIASHLLLRTGARAVLEDPFDERTACTYSEAGADLVCVPVDSRGLRPELLPGGSAALLHVTPEHQRPTGAPLGSERRAAVLDWAGRSGAIIVEEDCDGEFRYGGMEAAPLMSLDQHERVLLIGGFAVALGPWVTLGYMAVPPSLVKPAREARRLIDDSAEALESSALAEFLESGAYARHVHRLRKIYLGRRDSLVTALRRHFGPVETWGAGAGLHLTWQLPPELGTASALAERARQAGLEAEAVGPDDCCLLLGFGMLTESLLEGGVARLAVDANRRRPAARIAG
ncbi:MAG TPA: PLP-dependent aminotransferase family protein [Acetobacteraceae bacterium]|nr:PLP-dependent aminotransferase family protein [Acetobacteraceae bacterium]